MGGGEVPLSTLSLGQSLLFIKKNHPVTPPPGGWLFRNQSRDGCSNNHKLYQRRKKFISKWGRFPKKECHIFPGQNNHPREKKTNKSAPGWPGGGRTKKKTAHTRPLSIQNLQKLSKWGFYVVIWKPGCTPFLSLSQLAPHQMRPWALQTCFLFFLPVWFFPSWDEGKNLRGSKNGASKKKVCPQLAWLELQPSALVQIPPPLPPHLLRPPHHLHLRSLKIHKNLEYCPSLSTAPPTPRSSGRVFPRIAGSVKTAHWMRTGRTQTYEKPARQWWVQNVFQNVYTLWEISKLSVNPGNIFQNHLDKKQKMRKIVSADIKSADEPKKETFEFKFKKQCEV